MIMQYWKFMTRMVDHELPSGMESLPHLYRDTAIWSFIFTVFMLVTPRFFGTYYKKWYDGLDKRKKTEFPPYFVSMFHHLSVVPIAWYYVYLDTQLSDYSNGSVDYSWFVGFIVPLATGFVVGDTVCFAIFEALHGVPEYIIHHILTLWMIFALLNAPGQLTRYFPHMLICDTTNIFFNTAWLARLAGYRGHPLVSLCEQIFALSFLLIRTVNLALVLTLIFLSAPGQKMGLAKYTLPPIVFLQFYWMSKIAATALGLKKSKPAKAEGGKKKE